MDKNYISGIRLSTPIDKASYLHHLSAVKQLEQMSEITFLKPVTFFVGENGTGKSTLLEAIAVACGFNAEGGTRNFNFSTAYTHSELHKQSHGESFLSLVENRFGGNGLYLLDEPEAALSPSRLMVLIAKINQLVEDNSQFIIATHSPF